AAYSRTYLLFLTGLFVMGGGLAILQTASNPYITILGPVETAAKRISIMGICNKFAGALAPIILGYFLNLSEADKVQQSLATMGHEASARSLAMSDLQVVNAYISRVVVLIILAV